MLPRIHLCAVQLLRLVRCWLTALSLAFCLAARPLHADTRGKAEHVILMVWDGMRPDFVTQENAPNLWMLRRDGVFFANNHPAYPSSTNVNGAALATGDQPGRTGILGNQEFRPSIDSHKPFDTAEYPGLPATDPQLIARHLLVPTFPEILHAAGERTVIAGSKPVAQLFDRLRERKNETARQSAVLYRGRIFPESAAAPLMKTLGPFPTRHSFPNEKQDAWTTRALTEVLWKDGIPKFSLLWLSEPDFSQHETAPGSPASRAAIKCVDDNLGKVIAALKARDALPRTDILVVSDHGFSTIDQAVDVAEQLRAAGFDAVRELADEPPPGQVLVVTLGGAVEFYVLDHSQEVINRLVAFLQNSSFAGVIFTRQPHEGTFTFAQAFMETADPPDVFVACRWNEHSNKFDVPGAIASDIGHTAGQGTHTTLSRFDMHNTLIACGPDFRHGWIDETPSGNIDVAPTILAILGINPPSKMDGRVLAEAFSDKNPMPNVHVSELVAEKKGWHQEIRLTTVERTTYLVEGNGERPAATPTPNEQGGDTAPRTAAQSAPP